MIVQITEQQIYDRLGINPGQLALFCKHWNIIELALFGSVLRDDFNPDSDIDILVSFPPNHNWGLEFIQMREELTQLIKRPVDLLTRRSIEESYNFLRRQNILNSNKIIYVAR